MTYTHDRWEPEMVGRRLAALQKSEGEVIFAGNAGLVRARCLLTQRLWRMAPLAGTWMILVGATDLASNPAAYFGRWAATFSDGVHPAEEIRTSGTTAADTLWDAVDFLRWDMPIANNHR